MTDCKFFKNCIIEWFIRVAHFCIVKFYWIFSKSIKNEIKNFKREYQKEQLAKTKESDEKKKVEDDKSEILKELEKEKVKYTNMKEKLSVKGK